MALELRIMHVQMVFGRDMLLNTPSIADWEAIRRHKQQIVDPLPPSPSSPANCKFIDYMGN